MQPTNPETLDQEIKVQDKPWPMINMVWTSFLSKETFFHPSIYNSTTIPVREQYLYSIIP
jgi:hypothetical protein